MVDHNNEFFDLSRRKFGRILVGGVGSFALGIPGCRSATDHLTKPNKQERWYTTGKSIQGRYKVDIVVVGAGLSGLTAARILTKQKKNVLLLEARDRIGGRMYLENTLNDAVLDMGGQWVGDSQIAILHLLEELRINRFLSYGVGRSIHSWNGVKTAFDGDVARLLEGNCRKPYLANFEDERACLTTKNSLADCTGNKEQERIWRKFITISQSVSPEEPWKTKDAKLLDAITFQTWLENQGAKVYSQWLSGMLSRIGGSGGFEPSEVSLLHMAWTQRVAPQSDAPEKWLIDGGAGQIPAMLANDIHNHIVLSAHVNSIEQHSNGVTVRTNGLVVQAQRVIVAIPPPLRAGITFSPALPPTHMGFIQRSPMGSISKIHAVYPEAFWRKQCLSGIGTGNLQTCEFIADSSPENGKPGILTSFIAGSRNIELSNKSKQEIRNLVLMDFAHFLGPNVWKEVQFVHVNWNQEKWTSGAFTTYLPPGVWSTYSSGWRDPVGNVFWAGTETSEYWPGYFDGAVRAGLRAAEAARQSM